MSSRYDVLIDSSAFVGFYFPADPHHQRACKLFAQFDRENSQLVTTNLVVGETVTVLSHRQGQASARAFLSMIQHQVVLFFDRELEELALNFFIQQSKRGTSFVDCANVVAMRQFNIPVIASYDGDYKDQFGVTALQ